MEYKVINGTHYYPETKDQIIEVLESARIRGTRLRLYFGDSQTGKDWNEVYDVSGYISRSTGPKKIPILVYNSRSHGGGAILTHCIVKIETSKGKRVLYKHQTYHKD